tara:strand:- start:688 stop:1335 length:648 start_codon:yes stop_codon:yes gene_type:complete
MTGIKHRLPADLAEAELMLMNSLFLAIKTNISNRYSIDIRFEGLRLLPIALRLAKSIRDNKYKIKILWPDAGSTALAKQKSTGFDIENISFKDFNKSKLDESDLVIYLAVNPRHYDYDEFSKLCSICNSPILMLNGILEDPIVGIGSVGRDRRRNFIRSWTNIFWLEPINNGAILHHYPDDWLLFMNTDNGYIFLDKYSVKPTLEEIDESLFNMN